MTKPLIFLLGLCFSCSCAIAQKKFNYVDSAVIYENQTKAPEEDQVTEQEAAGDSTAAEEDMTADTSVHIRDVSVSPDSIAAWRSKKQFAYLNNLDSLLHAQQKQKNTAKDKTSASSRSGNGNAASAKADRLLSASWVKFVLWTIALLFVLYILSKLFLSKGFFSKKTSVNVVNELPATEDELYLQQNFDQLIHQACKLADYRVATRYLFLKTLQRLSDRSLIEFAIDKTNSKYVHEIPAAKRNEFAELVLSYEYIWYGSIAVNKEIYTSVETKFSAFLNKI